jgi:N-6 DNA Methylase
LIYPETPYWHRTRDCSILPIIENDWLEAIVALPDQLFYNTGISTYIWVLTNRKEPRRKGKVQLIDARQFYVKMKKSLGNKRNKIGDPADDAREKSPRASSARSRFVRCCELSRRRRGKGSTKTAKHSSPTYGRSTTSREFV